MADNYVQDGKRLRTINRTGAAVSAGDGMAVGATLRVALVAIANYGEGEAAAEGVFNLPATTTDVWADGAPLYWDRSTRKLTCTDTSDIAAGYAVGAKTNGQTTAKIKLWPFGTTNAGGSSSGTGV